VSLTKAQKEAVAARGNVLVVAGAGTGKTSTLVERCLYCLTAETPTTSLDEILMVTFTDAAAAEMRQRIRTRLEEKRAEPEEKLRWEEQLGLFDTAHIGTLHSFCLQLVRQHFYQLELDPQLAVMPEEEARLLADETLDELLQDHYAGGNKFAEDVQTLIQTQARGWDLPIRTLVLRLHHYTQTLRDPTAWYESQLALFESTETKAWRAWLLTGAREWRECWLPTLRSLSEGNEKAAECAGILEKLPAEPSLEEFAVVLRQVLEADKVWPSRKKGVLKKPIEDLFAEATFLDSLMKKGGEPLAEDWKWVREPMLTLIKLAREFGVEFGNAKRELGMVDFHDLEQHVLRLLQDTSGQPTAVAFQWREKLRFVFVDEYQDINEAQDAILQALSREGPESNRFLVGDVKQSIYRFRLADPRIFQNYMESWHGGAVGRSVALVDNFRSREGILTFVNALFGSLMRPEIGGVPYDDTARLRFGDPENRATPGRADDDPCVELHLRLQGRDTPAGEDAEPVARARIEVMNLEEAGKEARLVARRLKELKAAGHPIWDKDAQALRPVDWRDMAVLLRSPSGKAECFAREFSRLGVPLVMARGGFYESPEITDLLGLLKLLDNPLQDLPLLAVLHSPLTGLTLDELAEVRLAGTGQPFWTALQRFHESGSKQSGWPKVDRFVGNFAAWRRLARQVSLSRCLETVLDQTHYAEWLLTQPRGEQCRANVERLLALAQQFDQFQRQGLFRFLRFIEAQEATEAEPTVAAITGENSVSLLSIHQSKGLEFPVVVVADLGKAFNLNELKAEIILDEQYGLCPQIKPPHTGSRYPSLPYWLARRRQRQESLGEEMRLLYVAMTRARDLLVLSGSISDRKFNKQAEATADLSTAALLSARNSLDWILAWSAATPETFPQGSSGHCKWWNWTTCTDLDSRLADELPNSGRNLEGATSGGSLNDSGWKKLRARLAWKYPHADATHEPAKTSVTALRRQFELRDEDEATPRFRFPPERRASKEKLSAEQIGTAHHSFLQMLNLEKTGSLAVLREEAERLLAEKALTGDEVAHLDFAAVSAFWKSELGRKILAQAELVQRELPFTARFSPAELSEMPKGDQPSDDDFVVVQGVADLVVLLPGEIWVVDFKTDRMAESELTARVKVYQPQLDLYAKALGRVYRRPVTGAWLHFLALNRTLQILPGQNADSK
jgi:ATP-dependent helicase/nuclease subunit A